MNAFSLLFLFLGGILFVFGAVDGEIARWAALKYLGDEYSNPFGLKSRYGFNYLILDRRIPIVLQRRYLRDQIILCASLLICGLSFIVCGAFFIFSFVTLISLVAISMTFELHSGLKKLTD
jgi:hypothetical protein